MLGTRSFTSLLVDENKESWLVVTNNIIHVFTEKNVAIAFTHINEKEVTKVLHRYSDGKLDPLLFWQKIEEKSKAPAMRLFPSSEYENPHFRTAEDEDELSAAMDKDIDFYELVAANDSDTETNITTEEPKKED